MIQELVLNQLIHNQDFFDKVVPHLTKDYFEGEPERIVFGLMDSFAQEYNAKPTAEAIAVMAHDAGIPEGLWEKVVEVVGSLEAPYAPQEMKWLLDQTEKWMRDRAVYNVITDAVDIYSNSSRREELNSIASRMEDALVVGFDDDIGMVYWDMAGEHYDYMHSSNSRIPFTVGILNKITNGGVWLKTLNAINAGINVGKTTALIDLSAQYASQGFDVVYFTFEVSQNMVRHRMDCRILDRPFSYVEALSRHEYVAHIKSTHERSEWGNIYIKEFPAGGAHTGHCRSYIKDLMKRKNAKPTFVMFDYVGEMCSERLPMAMMGKTDLYYGSIARECRALAFEFNTANWTALQFQRGMQNTKEMTIDGQADSITIPKVLDFQLGLSVPDEYAQMDQAWGVVMKNRYADKNKLKNFIIGLNQSYQKMYDVDPEMQTFAAGELSKSPIPDTAPSSGGSVAGAPNTSLSKYKKIDTSMLGNMKI